MIPNPRFKTNSSFLFSIFYFLHAKRDLTTNNSPTDGAKADRRPTLLLISSEVTDLRKLLPYLRHHLYLLVLALVLLVASGALETVLIMLLAPIFNNLSAGGGVVAGGED